MIQSELFNEEEARKRRDEGMKRAEDGAAPLWKDAALFAVMEAAKHNPFFTADDIWQYMPPGVTTTDNRALGPVMMSVCKGGYITRTKEVRESTRPALHMCPRRVWRSNVYQVPE